MKCEIKVETTSNGYHFFIDYKKDRKIIYTELLDQYDTHPYPESVVKDVAKRIFNYKRLGIPVEIIKSRNINNMYNLDNLLKELEF